MLGGRKVTVTRPRARHLDGSGEVELATYKHFNTEDLLGEMALERMVAGLSTRNYSAGLEPVGDVEAIRIDDLDRAYDDAKRQALARRKDDRALDRGRHARGREALLPGPGIPRHPRA